MGGGEPNDPFDYGSLDEGWTSPLNPLSTHRHFRSREDVNRDMERAVRNGDRQAFEEHMHEGQDSFCHYDNGYRWYTGGHVLDSVLNELNNNWGNDPDNVGDNRDAYQDAREWTQQWEDRWNEENNQDTRSEE